MNLVEEALTGHWGPKCSEYEEGCVVCDAWREYENLATYGETLRYVKSSHMMSCPSYKSGDEDDCLCKPS